MMNFIEVHKAATSAATGKNVNVREVNKLTLQVFGTSTTHEIDFYGSLNGEDFAPMEGLKVGDTTISASQTVGIDELWEFDVTMIVSFRAVLTSISDGNVSIVATTSK